MSQKRVRVRIQKNPAQFREEEKADVGVPRKVNSRTKKTLTDSAEVIAKINELLKETATKIRESSRPIQPFKYRPRVPNCEGRMTDLLRR